MIIRKNLLAAATVCLLETMHANAAVAQSTQQYNLPEQSLAQSLRAIGRLTGMNVLFVPDNVANVTAGAVVGTLSANQAVSKAIAGTGLVARAMNGDSILVGTAETLDRHAGATSMQISQPRYIRLAQAERSATPPAADADVVLDEVVVTSQKRKESMLDVPISMTVLDTAEIEALRVQSIENFVFMLPNVSYNRYASFESTVTLRGIGGNSGGRFNPTLVTVDDAAFGSTGAAGILTSRLLDPERIEVLRGPQGTLTGASAMGGIINIITRKPKTDTFDLTGTLDYSRFNTRLIKVAANTPVSEQLAFRTVAYSEDSDGAIRNLGPSGGDSGYDHFGGRLAMHWAPTEQMTVDAAWSREEQRFGFSTSMHLDRFSAGDGIPRDQAIAELAAAGADYFTTEFLNDVGNNGGHIYSDVAAHSNVTNQMGSLRASYDLGSHAVDLIYGQHSSDMDVLRDRDKSELAISKQTRRHASDSQMAELRVVSEYQGAFNWVAGVSHSDESWAMLYTGFSGDRTIGGVYRFTGTGLWEIGLVTTGLFANAFWDITDRVHLSAGARYSDVKSATFSGFQAVSQEFGAPQGETFRASLSEFDPRVALNFDLTGNVTAYAQFATGFRAGYGNDPRAVGVNDTSIGVVDVPRNVDQEKVKNYELGLKGRLWGGRVSFAAAVFETDYDDLQVYGGWFVQGEEDLNFDINAGSAYTRGFEFEMQALPYAGLQLRAGVGYVETRLEEFMGEKVEGDASISDIRPWTLSAGATYSWQVGQGVDAHARIDYVKQSKTEPNFGQYEDSQFLPAFQTVNLSAGVDTGRWSLVAYIENALDEIYWLGDYGGVSRRGAEANFVPRTFGLRYVVNFGG